jgi:hypothetical protein
MHGTTGVRNIHQKQRAERPLKLTGAVIRRREIVSRYSAIYVRECWLRFEPIVLIEGSNPSYDYWRRERDSNPRYVAVYTLSRRAPSTTRTPLQFNQIVCASNMHCAVSRKEHRVLVTPGVLPFTPSGSAFGCSDLFRTNSVNYASSCPVFNASGRAITVVIAVADRAGAQDYVRTPLIAI